MRGTVPCLSADLTTHAVQNLTPVGFENEKACAPRRAMRGGDERGKRRRCARVLGLPLSWLDRRDDSSNATRAGSSGSTIDFSAQRQCFDGIAGASSRRGQ